MLTRFEVSNFKSFNKNFVFDLKDTSDFQFNKEYIKNKIVNKAIIYGRNGCGKSNLGFAIFDLVSHLTDRSFQTEHYENYLNGNNNGGEAKFNFEFNFDDDIIKYSYKKKDYQTLINEELIINDKNFASIDRKKNNIFKTSAKGAETLNKDLGDSNISIISYIAKNTILEKNDINDAFKKFKTFVNTMLFVRTLGSNTYIGYEQGAHKIDNEIVKKGNLQDFQEFLNYAGIKCKLTEGKVDDEYKIFFVFDNKEIDFYKIASSGTKALAVLYLWYKRLQKNNEVSFLFIDEFDAFYHHELSRLIVSKLKELTNIQVVLTTHNTSIISNELLRPDCYFLMDEEKIKPLTKCTEKELREAHNIEKMYRAGSFE